MNSDCKEIEQKIYELEAQIENAYAKSFGDLIEESRIDDLHCQLTKLEEQRSKITYMKELEEEVTQEKQNDLANKRMKELGELRQGKEQDIEMNKGIPALPR